MTDITRITAIATLMANTVFAAEDCIEGGAPKVDVLEGLLGHDITAAERDAAWEVFQAALSDAEAEKARLEAELASQEGVAAAAVEQLDALEAELVTDDETPLEPAPEGMIRIIVRKMYVERLPLFVHGVGTFEIVRGEEITLPADAVDALRNSDIEIEEV